MKWTRSLGAISILFVGVATSCDWLGNKLPQDSVGISDSLQRESSVRFPAQEQTGLAKQGLSGGEPIAVPTPGPPVATPRPPKTARIGREDALERVQLALEAAAKIGALKAPGVLVAAVQTTPQKAKDVPALGIEGVTTTTDTRIDDPIWAVRMKGHFVELMTEREYSTMVFLIDAESGEIYGAGHLDPIPGTGKSSWMATDSVAP